MRSCSATRATGPTCCRRRPRALAAMAAIVATLKPHAEGAVRRQLSLGPVATVALAVATGASFAREVFTGVYASDMGLWQPRLRRARCACAPGSGATTSSSCSTSTPSSRHRSTPGRSSSGRRVPCSRRSPTSICVSGPMTGQAVDEFRAEPGQGRGSRNAGLRQYRGQHRQRREHPGGRRRLRHRHPLQAGRQHLEPGRSPTGSRASWTGSRSCAAAMAVTLGLDIGTTSTIGILIDTEGRDAGHSPRGRRRCISPHPGWAEEDPGAVVAQRLRRDRASCWRGSGLAAGEIAAVGVTGMLPAVVLLDGEGRLLRRSIQQSDGRAGREVAELAAGDRRGGVPRAHRQRHQPAAGRDQAALARAPRARDASRRIATVFGSYDYINWRLTGARALEHNWALESGFLRSRERGDRSPTISWRSAASRPPCCRRSARSDEVIGAGHAARPRPQTGLAAGTPVVAGCADHVASAYVAGVRAAGRRAAQVRRRRRHPARDRPSRGPIRGCSSTTTSCRACSCPMAAWPPRARCSTGSCASSGGGRTPCRELRTSAGRRPNAARRRRAGPAALFPRREDADPRSAMPAARWSGSACTTRSATSGARRSRRWCIGFRHHVEVSREIGYPVDAAARLRRRREQPGLDADRRRRPASRSSCSRAIRAPAWAPPMSRRSASARWTTGTRSRASYDPAGAMEPDASTAGAYAHAFGLFRETYQRLKPLYPSLVR